MRDRERLAQDGFVVAYVPVNKKNKLVGEPRIISRGFLRMDSSTGLMDAAQKELKRALKHNGSFPDDTVRETLQNFFYQQTHSRPVVLPNIVRI